MPCHAIPIARMPQGQTIPLSGRVFPKQLVPLEIDPPENTEPAVYQISMIKISRFLVALTRRMLAFSLILYLQRVQISSSGYHG